MDGTISSASGGDASTSGGGAQAASVPMASQSNAPPPFLSKTYDMVDDPATDAVVSWSSTNNSFCGLESAGVLSRSFAEVFQAQ
ncbi:hypothetical protein OIU84_004343 [Salix udensis]|uniref:HSF-type DNA-binding domain-containing protein n=1 Tax=Salix udensis TaxID=889485 RepID=A0AAD6K410_9ROSI|nr:hypothetical protein OIU84_004343 [Salix udensis]